MPPEVGNIAIAIITVRQPHVSQEFRHMPEDFMSASLPKFGRYKVWIVSCLKDDLGSGSVVLFLLLGCGAALPAAAPWPQVPACSATRKITMDLGKATSLQMLDCGKHVSSRIGAPEGLGGLGS